MCKLTFPVSFLLKACFFKRPKLCILALRFCFGLVRNLAFSAGKVNRGAGVDGYVLSVVFLP